MAVTWSPDLIQDTLPTTRTCAVCGYVGTTRDVHTQATRAQDTAVSRLICCTCLGHPKGSCWRENRFPKTEKERLKLNE